MTRADSFDRMPQLIHAETLQTIGGEDQQAIREMLPIFMEDRLVAQRVDGMGTRPNPSVPPRS